MAKSHPRSRGRSPLVIQVELLEDRRLLSGSGRGVLLHEPLPPPAVFSAASPFSTPPTASFKEETPAQKSPFPGKPAAPSAAPPSQARPAGGLPTAPPSESAGPARPGPEPGARSVGRGDSQAQANQERATPPGRALGTGRAYGLATADDHAAAAGKKEKAGANPITAGPEAGRIPPGLVVVASGQGSSDSAPAPEASPALDLGQVPSAPPGTGLPPESAASRSDRPRAEAFNRSSRFLSGLPVPFQGIAFDAGALGISSIRVTTAPSETTEGRDGLAPSETVRQGQAQAAALADGSSGGDRHLVPAPGNRGIGSSLGSTRHRGELTPEVTGLEPESPSYPVQALLRELEKLREQLQSAGEHAIGWLFDREVAEWILLALVVAVTAEIARREFRHAEVDPSLVDGDGFQSPWMA